MNKKPKGFSKKLLIADYIIAVVMIAVFFICVALNGIYVSNTTKELIKMGTDISMLSITLPFNLDIFGVFLSTWIVQLGVSSGAYYMMAKSEHKIELPMKLINELPQDIKEQVDMNELISTVLSCTDN